MKKFYLPLFFLLLSSIPAAAHWDETYPNDFSKKDTLNKDSCKKKKEQSLNLFQFNPDSSESEFKGWAINSVFTIPAVRFNMLLKPSATGEKGTIEYFNSLGAGISFSRGIINVRSTTGKISESKSRDLDIEMKNIFGFGFGVLFSRSEDISSSGSRAVFAPVVSLQVLDFHFGSGYELGTVSAEHSRFFFTIAYGVPITKLTRGGSYLLSRPKNEANHKVQLNTFF